MKVYYKIKQKGKQMEKLKLPTEVVSADWTDDIDTQESYLDYLAPYKNEENYQSEPVSKEGKFETAKEAKSRNRKLGRIALFKRNEKIAA